MQTQLLEYQVQDSIFEAYVAWDETITIPRPAVLIFHDWTGRYHFTEKKAEQLAELGYVGIAIDMYGKGKIGQTKEEKGQLMQPLMADRNLLKQRVVASYEIAKTLSQVDPQQIGAMGFCFGGLCALDLARSGVLIKGAISFHGSLVPPANASAQQIQCPLLILHGYDDPMVPPTQVAAFEQEMTQAKVDWQIHVYSKTMHSFTNPEANDPGFGTVYNPVADRRSWVAMQNFWEEVFS